MGILSTFLKSACPENSNLNAASPRFFFVDNIKLSSSAGPGQRQLQRVWIQCPLRRRHSTRDGGPTSRRLQGTVSVRTELSTTRPLPEVLRGHPQIHVTRVATPCPVLTVAGPLTTFHCLHFVVTPLLPASTVTKPPSMSADLVSAKFMMCLKPTVLITSSPW